MTLHVGDPVETQCGAQGTVRLTVTRTWPAERGGKPYARAVGGHYDVLAPQDSFLPLAVAGRMTDEPR